jgi:hypothetical protein
VSRVHLEPAIAAVLRAQVETKQAVIFLLPPLTLQGIVAAGLPVHEVVAKMTRCSPSVLAYLRNKCGSNGGSKRLSSASTQVRVCLANQTRMYLKLHSSWQGRGIIQVPVFDTGIFKALSTSMVVRTDEREAWPESP